MFEFHLFFKNKHIKNPVSLYLKVFMISIIIIIIIIIIILIIIIITIIRTIKIRQIYLWFT